jgi:hypothetical protein
MGQVLMAVNDRPQLTLFAAAEDVPRTGPEGLLAAIIRQGLDPGALEYAAKLVLELDAMAWETQAEAVA